jgi:hypothetical protein
MTLIEDADLVIGVLDDPAASTNISFELGYAFARDKKILLILDGRFRTVPTDLVSTLHVQSRPNDVEAISYNLDALLAAPAPMRRPYIPEKADTHAIGPLADALLSRLAKALEEHDGLELERIVADALRASSVAAVTTAQDRGLPDTGPDIGIWSDDLESSVGNPLLIEIKTKLRSTRDVRELQQRVEAYMRARNVQWGLVLFGQGQQPVEAAFDADSPVLFLQVGDLLERLRTEGFAKIVGDVHARAIQGH